MKTINLFKYANAAYENKERIKRIYKNMNTIYKVVKFGSKAGKVNPANVVIDAISSLIDLFNSYLTYKKTQEITKRMKVELNDLTNLYEIKKREINEILQTLKLNVELSIEEIKSKISNNELFYQNLKKLYEESKTHLEMCKELLNNIKSNNYWDDEYKNIEAKYITAVTNRLKLTILLIGGDNEE